jgi:tetratricopeptide (TPR) repeat protein
MLLAAMLLSASVAVSPGVCAAAPAPEAQARGEDLVQRGLASYRRLRLREAEGLFQDAAQADPCSAPAAYYLAYTVYKRAEPLRPFHPDKQRAARLFARAYELDPGFRPDWGW